MPKSEDSFGPVTCELWGERGVMGGGVWREDTTSQNPGGLEPSPGSLRLGWVISSYSHQPAQLPRSAQRVCSRWRHPGQTRYGSSRKGREALQAASSGRDAQRRRSLQAGALAASARGFPEHPGTRLRPSKQKNSNSKTRKTLGVTQAMRGRGVCVRRKATSALLQCGQQGCRIAHRRIAF